MHVLLSAAPQPALQFTLHEVTYDELYGKPQWFRDLHPQGLIPVIAFKQSAGSAPPAAPTAAAEPGLVSIKESLICNEYLEDAYPQPPVSVTSLFVSVVRAAC
jgi:glutathione S-transferase